MLFTKNEMLFICAAYAGTFSATRDLIREVENPSPNVVEVYNSVMEKLDAMKCGDAVSLYFEPEQ